MKFGQRFPMHDQELSLLTLSAIWFILEYSHWVYGIPVDLTHDHVDLDNSEKDILLNKGVPSLLGVVPNYEDLFASVPLVAKACLGSRMQ